MWPDTRHYSSTGNSLRNENHVAALAALRCFLLFAALSRKKSAQTASSSWSSPASSSSSSSPTRPRKHHAPLFLRGPRRQAPVHPEESDERWPHDRLCPPWCVRGFVVRFNSRARGSSHGAEVARPWSGALSVRFSAEGCALALPCRFGAFSHMQTACPAPSRFPLAAARCIQHGSRPTTSSRGTASPSRSASA